MASRALAACARSPDDYARVYGRVLAQVRAPVILHWLGEMFDPALAGYWVGAGGLASDPDHARATDVCAAVIGANAAKVDGVKVSLLDAAKEIALRARLPQGVRMYTGDDFNFAALIGGDATGHSDALLGIFDAIAPAASAALTALAAGDRARFDAILAPTVPLSRHVFAAPTRFYKTGVVFLAWLNGHQAHFTMVGGQQSARSLVHLSELFRLADAAGLLRDPELAARADARVPRRERRRRLTSGGMTPDEADRPRPRPFPRGAAAEDDVSDVDATVHVYAEEGPDLADYLQKIAELQRARRSPDGVANAGPCRRRFPGPVQRREGRRRRGHRGQQPAQGRIRDPRGGRRHATCSPTSRWPSTPRASSRCSGRSPTPGPGACCSTTS